MSTKPEDWTLEQLDRLPEYQEDEDISCLVNIRKLIDGEPHEFTLKVRRDGEEKLKKTRSIPLLTQPTRNFHNGDGEPQAWSTIYDSLRMAYMDYVFHVDRRYHDICALTAMSSYFRECFNTYPYLDFYSAEVDCGKSTAMKAFVYSSFYGDLMTAPTPAVIYRDINESKCTLGIDEIDNALTNKDLKGFLLSVLNSGYMKGIPAKRCDPNTQRVVRYDAFGVKAFTRIGSINRTIESRSITINMIRNPADNLLKELESSEPFREMRDQLYRARLERYLDVGEAALWVRDNSGLRNRTRQLFTPILTIARLVSEEVYDEALSFAKEYAEQRQGESDNPVTRVLVEILLRPAYLGHEVPVVNIVQGLNDDLLERKLRSEDYEFRSRGVISMLKSLGLKRSPKRTRNYVHYFMNAEIVLNWGALYSLDVSPQTSLSSLASLSSPEDEEKSANAELSEVKSEGSEGSEGEGDIPQEELVERSTNLEHQEEVGTRVPSLEHRTLREWTEAVLGFFDPDLANNGQTWHMGDIIAQWPEHDSVVYDTVMRLMAAGLLMEVAPAQYRRVT